MLKAFMTVSLIFTRTIFTELSFLDSGHTNAVSQSNNEREETWNRDISDISINDPTVQHSYITRHTHRRKRNLFYYRIVFLNL